VIGEENIPAIAYSRVGQAVNSLLKKKNSSKLVQYLYGKRETEEQGKPRSRCG